MVEVRDVRGARRDGGVRLDVWEGNVSRTRIWAMLHVRSLVSVLSISYEEEVMIDSPSI